MELSSLDFFLQSRLDKGLSELVHVYLISSWRRVTSKDGSTTIIQEYVYKILEGF